MGFIKGKLRGLFAFVASALVALAMMPATALAAAPALSKGTATVTGVQGATKVELFKVASVTNGADNVLVYTIDESYGVTLNEYRANPEAVANTIASKVTGIGIEGVIEGNTATFSNLDAGLYFVKVTPEQAGVVYQPVLMPVVPTAQANGTWGAPTGEAAIKKSDNNVETSLTKKVSTDDKSWQDGVNTLSAGDTAHFKVTVQIPQYTGLTESSNITFTVTDTLPAGLSYVNDSAKADNGAEVTVSGKVITATMDAKDLMNIGKGATLTLTLDATVDANQLGVLTNTANVTWYKHASDAQPETTENVDATVTVYGAKVGKFVGTNQDNNIVVADDAEALNGAHFKLQRLNGDAYVDVAGATDLTASNYTEVVKSLGAGTYKWVETQAPAGYKLNDAGVVFTVGTTENADNNWTNAQKYGDIAETPVDQLLPKTGGAGTVAITAAGVALMAGAGMWLVRSRKND